MRKLQQQRAFAAANRETDTQTQDMLNRSLANFHILATAAVDPNLEQLIAPQPLPLFPTQPMDLEPNPVDQIPMHDFNLAEIPRVPAPHPPDYDPWFDDHRNYEQRYPIPDEPMPNLAAYSNLDPLDPYYDNDQFIREILENPYPPEEPMPQFPNPIPAPAPPMSTENVQELRTFGEELLEGSERMRQIGERLV
ncbi:uncharacterized protein LOC110895740 [Helianthus annuus]|uniref:uncharacterized protein LOC110895740 n=1 Tax=Helianthus annuus TaxID=4232 RepID=UPI000B9080B6|nr:uncharacterized protein LOC110895740 [Helianthus annuus]